MLTEVNAQGADRMQENCSIQCRVCLGQTKLMPWKGCVCTICGSVSVASPPTDAELTEYYNQFNQDFHGGGRREGAAARQWKRAMTDLKRIQSLQPTGSLIDIGCSTSPFPNLAHQARFDVVAVDYVRPPRLDKTIPFIMGSLNNPDSILTKINRQFNVVTALYVLEHCLDPRGALDTMWKLCAPGGLIVISTPEINCFADRNALGYSPWFFPPQHIHLVSKEGMIRFYDERNTRLVYARKQEHTVVRWLLRYGYGWAQGLAGCVVRLVSRDYWQEVRARKQSRVQNIGFYIFRKR